MVSFVDAFLLWFFSPQQEHQEDRRNSEENYDRKCGVERSSLRKAVIRTLKSAFFRPASTLSINDIEAPNVLGMSTISYRFQ